MNDLIDKLLKLPVSKIVLIAGVVMMAGGFGAETMGLSIPMEMHRVAVFLGAIMVVMALVANDRKRTRQHEEELARRKADVELRKAKLDAGLDPNDDKTVMKRPK